MTSRDVRGLTALVGAGAAVIALVAIPGSSPASSARRSEIIRVSTGLDGGPPDGISVGSAVSDDGRLVVYTSVATNLVAGDTNGTSDGFLTDVVAGTTTVLSHRQDGTQCDEMSGAPSISGDGRWVALETLCAISPSDTNDQADIYLVDLQTTTSALVSKAVGGGPSNGFSSTPSVSGDGGLVAFASDATDLVTDDTDGTSDVFVWERSTGTTTLISRTRRGQPGNGRSSAPDIAADGRSVAFVSEAAHLTGDPVGRFTPNIFVWNRQTGTISLISRAGDGGAANAQSAFPSISPRGRFVAYGSAASNIVAGDNPLRDDVFLFDRRTGATSLVSHARDGGPANTASFRPSISEGGRVVAFWSFATNLTREVSRSGNVFTWNRKRDAISLVSVSATHPHRAGDAISFDPAISRDGRVVVFESLATNLIPDRVPVRQRSIYLARPLGPA